MLALRTGARQSELLALKWEDVDFDTGRLAIRRALVRVRGGGLATFDPKTAASKATVPLTPRAIAVLRAHRVRQMEARLRAGSAWQDAGFIFATEIGTPISASNMLRRHFRPICARAGIPTGHQPDGSPGLRFHDLRHSCGSLLIERGAKPKVVQAILRHAKLSTTMDLYVHAYDHDLALAVNTLDEAVER